MLGPQPWFLWLIPGSLHSGIILEMFEGPYTILGMTYAFLHSRLTCSSTNSSAPGIVFL